MASKHKLLERARLSMQNKEYEKAESILAGLNSDPRMRGADSLVLHGSTLESQQEFRRAAEMFESAGSHAATAGDKARAFYKAFCMLYAVSDRRDADSAKSVDLLEESARLDPGLEDSVSKYQLCSIYYAQHEYKKLQAHAADLLEIPKHNVQARLWMGFACFYLDEKSRGVSCLRELVETSAVLSTDHLFSLLDLLVFFSCFEDAKRVIDKAPESQRATYWMAEFRADIHLGEKNYDAALGLLTDDTIAGCNDDGRRRRLYAIRAKCLQAKKDFDAAHESFTAMNDLARASAVDNPPSDIAVRYERVSLADLPVYRPTEALPYEPIFMIGFPRSGTTLLDTILDTQADIHTFSEFDGMTFARRAMTALGKRYPEDLSSLSEAEVGKLRQAYFDRNSHYISAGDVVDVMIDKLPLNLIQIPLIVTLFPRTKFILSLRHPVDVCLSCFQQDFMLNGEMVYFTSLEDCFTRYRDLMLLLERYVRELDLRIHTVRYEELVSDLQGVAESVFSFIGVSPGNDYTGFHRLNQDRALVTPSRAQVTQPLYKSSRGRWRNYEEHLRPYIGVVQPFIEKFGYEV